MSNQISLQYNIKDILDEYNKKLTDLPNKISDVEAAIQAITYGINVAGAYGGHSVNVNGLYLINLKNSLLVSAWRAVYQRLNLKDILPLSDRDKFERSIQNPPELNVENIILTFGDYVVNYRYHLLRGLAECFVKLDPAYKSHNKVKIGTKGLPKRIILNNVVGEYGTKRYGFERIVDVLRVLRVYRNLPTYDHIQLSDFVNDAFKNSTATLDGFTLKIYQNGNGHLYFDEDTLLDINKALAEFYGDILPDVEEPNAKKQASTAVSKDLQFYPTPRKVLERIFNDITIHGDKSVLEPSCGTGNILEYIREISPDAYLTGIEYDHSRAVACRQKGFTVLERNFLEVSPTPEFDYVIMNPPFYGKHYRLHLEHALKFLKPCGLCVCILPASAYYDHGNLPQGRWVDLPVASFRESGTNISTGYLVIRKGN